MKLKTQTTSKIILSKKYSYQEKRINKLNTENIADLLEKGGISVQEKSIWRRKPNIRGFEANKILLVVDG